MFTTETQRARRKTDFGLRIVDCGMGRVFGLCVLCVLCGCLWLSAENAHAAQQEVVPLNGAAFQGETVGIDANALVIFHVAEKKDQKSGNRSFPLDQLVRWGNPAALRPQTVVVLADGGRIVTAADWSGGAAVRLVGDDVVLLSDTWNEVHLQRRLVSGVVFAQQSRSDERERLVEQVRGEPSPNLARQSSPQASLQGRGDSESDALLLTNGDRLTGKLTQLDRGSLAIETLGGVAKLPLSRVEAIVFGKSRQPSPVGHEQKAEGEPSAGPSLQGNRNIAVGMKDGSVLYAKTIRANEKEIEIELASGVKLKGGTVGNIVALQSLGGRVVYLSDLDGADYRSAPYLSIAWPYSRDRNVLGGPIVVRGKRYWKGIGMHSAARLTYRFNGDYQWFDSAVAIDDSAKGRGSVTFGVYVSRDGKWSEAYKSGIVRGGEAPIPVSVDLRGARGLTLTVDFADRGDELDHAVWLDARLVR
jgi:hypothetical protein